MRLTKEEIVKALSGIGFNTYEKRDGSLVVVNQRGRETGWLLDQHGLVYTDEPDYTELSFPYEGGEITASTDEYVTFKWGNGTLMSISKKAKK